MNILFCLTGSIACFKSAQVISKLVQKGHHVKPVATKSALEFIGIATLEGLTGEPVFKETFTEGRMMDHIHLTKAGYQIKGGLLFTSMMNTLDSLSFNPQCSSLTVPMKQYETANVQVIPINPQPASVYYSVKSGDTLSAIANKYSTTVAKIKARNGLSSDKITVGQRLVIP